jgi:hypothetical protein
MAESNSYLRQRMVITYRDILLMNDPLTMCYVNVIHNIENTEVNLKYKKGNI